LASATRGKGAVPLAAAAAPVCLRRRGMYGMAFPCSSEWVVRNVTHHNLDHIDVLASDWPEYELIDSGNRRKLERFGSHRLVRSEPKAWWAPDLPAVEWSRDVAAVEADGQWKTRGDVPRQWPMRFGKCVFEVRLTGMSKHVGIFPEQSPHWQWIQQKAAAAKRPLRVLSLFGYTGAASLVAAAEGCAVTHVDASKPAMSWARHNQQLSGLADAPVRWLLDDAFKFVKREVRRRNVYDAFILDPPSFGRGPNKEVWKVEEQLAELLSDCRSLCSDRPQFIILTMYSIEASAILVGNMLADMMRGMPGHISVGELTLPQQHSGKRLSLSIFGRWEAAG
jgi:23S rRNA (cytosine1962-C5)-methyltransferase